MTDTPDAVPDELLDDLRSRLRATRRLRLPGTGGWSLGADPDYLADLLAYWAESYDWRTHEERLRALPWVRTGADGTGLRSVHARAGDGATPVVLLHGWPDSFVRFDRVLPLLADLDVVVPCLPGYPWSDERTGGGMASAAMADVVAAAMAELGYDRYVVSGGDIGSGVAEALAAKQPEHVAALHLTDVPYSYIFTVDPAHLTDEEQAYIAEGMRWRDTEGAYAMEQATKPYTLAAGLGDSPAGLAAWIVEKLRSWSDCGGDVESVWPRDDLLTWITLYWVSGAIGTSFAPYALREQPADRVGAPTVVQQFPHDLVLAPRAFAERVFDVRVWEEPADGGHFAAWERPEVFTAGLRKAVALAR